MSDKLIFTLGFTDNITDEWTVQETKNNLNPTQTSYNLKKMVPEVEKWSANWEIDMSKRHNQIVFHNWETIIRVPHLRMVDIFQTDVPYIDDYKTMGYQISFINLIPVKGINVELFDYNTDTEVSTSSVGWGSICLDLNTMIATGNKTELPLMQEFLFNENITDIPELLDMRLSPKFNFQFPIGFSEFGVKRVNSIDKMTTAAREKYLKYKKELESAGFTDIGVLNFAHNGMIEVGKLMNEPIEIIDKLKESPYICRVSLTKPE
jgi:hypothetical protein